MNRTSTPVDKNNWMTNSILIGLRLLGLMLLIIVFGCGSITQAVATKSYPILPSQVLQAPTPQPELLDGTQDTHQLFIPLITGNIIISNTCSGNCYYFDSVNGSDANPGTSIDKPWRSLSKMNATHFYPGDIIHLKRGSSWTGGLIIDNSGVEGQPITFTTYGTGPRPVFRNPGDSSHNTHAVKIVANWIVVEGLTVRDAQVGGVTLQNSNHNVIRDIEATNVGLGISISGQYNLVTRNYIHDLHMVRNTSGGNDDYGAIGILLSYASNNELSYNTVINCIATSIDYGLDGGVVEWWGNSDGNYVHNNWTIGNKGFLEVGGGSARNTVVSYNISINNGRFSWIHISDTFASDVENFQVDNNTIVETTTNGWVIFGFNGNPGLNTLLLRNNILYIDGFSFITNKPSFTHDHNLYFLSGGTETGYSLGQGEMISDPIFVDLAGSNFHLLSQSPAIDAGINLGYSFDFLGDEVPTGAAPDIGAFEYQSAP